MYDVLDQVERLSGLSWPVLIHGESGVGKERIAEALHASGRRCRGPFVPLNAGGLPPQLIESELFGHERGAFTGAVASHRGVFERAHGGTLFLDEIGELPLELQTRLLRILETWEVRRVGGEAASRVDVRLVCATHRDIRAMVAAGAFREDLYYRIARLLIEVPPLRSRREDIAPLSIHFLRQIAAEVGHRWIGGLAMARLESHAWPGNVRELRNVLCAAAASTSSAEIRLEHVERALVGVGGGTVRYGTTPEHLQQVVDDHHGNVSAAARALGMPRTTLRDRLKGVRSTGPVGCASDRYRISRPA
jgi:DNA-binding NtrC family response regulator